MTEITKLVKNLRHWASMASLTSEQVSCLSVQQLETIANELDSAHQLIAELESFRTAYMEWSDKTDWIQTDRRFDMVKPLGKHRADVLKTYIDHLESRAVKLPKRTVGEVMHISGFSRDYAEGWCSGNDNAIHEMRAAGIKVEGE
ncbi:hypothetical protein PIA91_10650 [Klebsiella michiganensis]|uniref:hypothetical protein n=1 Tax=Klebsiella michiganensis TaxID=1134687 RepID=UPI00237C47C1|nr:hypothetical protein [Klebsiella michiganensis]MDD9629796.1 hypothetical protein [Klebsiella michiganensis]MDD9635156.1 hypothetical protein [Klebsiella michiganensis]MDD9646492.1 hypothetical protein [Klebsiella michiganensis]MDD9656022.1 hypothetical protein [Klebsiella michiganensis]